VSREPAARPTFFQGQYLGPEDLSAGLVYNAEQVARHELAAHTWGIGQGLRVTWLEGSAAAAAGYRIEPGVAWDGFGRLLLLIEPIPIPVSAVVDLTGPETRFTVWLRYRETPSGVTPPGFRNCDSNGTSRLVEGVQVEVRNITNTDDTHSAIDPPDRLVPPTRTVEVPDESIPFQRFPEQSDGRWLVPIGVLRWRSPVPGGVGPLAVGEFLPPVKTGDSDSDAARRIRRLVGVVAGSVLGTEGHLHLHSRPNPPTLPLMLPAEPLWLDGDTRVDGALRAFGDLAVSRGAPGSVVESLVVRHDNGRVGIGTGGVLGGPTQPLHVADPEGIRQGELYLSGGPRWSSLAYNAHHAGSGSPWVFPAATQGSSTIEIDDAGDKPRISLYTREKAALNWQLGLHLDGATNHVGFGGEATDRSTLTVREGKKPSLSLEVEGPAPEKALRFVATEHLGVAGTEGIPLLVHSTEGLTIDATSNLDLATGTLSRVRVTPDGRVGIGTVVPEVAFHVSQFVPNGDSVSIPGYVAVIENTASDTSADVLALRLGVSASGLNGMNNFITFFAGPTPVGCIEGTANGVGFISGRADFAEAMPATLGETFVPGDVVAVINGRVTLSTVGASWISVVTDQAIVLGNSGRSGGPEIPLTMIGQVPVRVRGSSNAGDLLVPSGAGDGAAEAISPFLISSERAAQAFGEVVSPYYGESEVGEHKVCALIGSNARSTALLHVMARMERYLQSNGPMRTEV
jgi:hypothetical protein